MNDKDYVLPNPFCRPKAITVTLEINGTKYQARFPSDANPAEIGELVTETIEIAQTQPREYTKAEIDAIYGEE